MLLDGSDPIMARREARLRARASAVKAMTFKQCAEAYMKTHRAGWKNARGKMFWIAASSNNGRHSNMVCRLNQL